MGRRPVVVLVTVALALAACGGSSSETGGAADGASPGASTGGSIAPVGSLDEAQQQAVADLADSLGVARDEVTVVTAEQVTWRDGSLGCPQPGMTYTQSLVDGYRIVLAAGGTEYHYHGRDGAAPTPCPSPAPDATVGSS